MDLEKRRPRLHQCVDANWLVAVTRDLVFIEAAVPEGGYPTVNTMFETSAMRGRKTAAYHEVFTAFTLAAQSAVGAGFSFTDCQLEAHLTLYLQRDNIDCGNIGKVEPDALQKAGLIRNDRDLRPFTKDVQIDHDGPQRIVFIGQRRFAPSLVAARVPRRRDGGSGTQRSRVAEPERAAVAPTTAKARRRGAHPLEGGSALSAQELAKVLSRMR